MSDEEWAREAVALLLMRCFCVLAGEAEKQAARLRVERDKRTGGVA